MKGWNRTAWLVADSTAVHVVGERRSGIPLTDMEIFSWASGEAERRMGGGVNLGLGGTARKGGLQDGGNLASQHQEPWAPVHEMDHRQAGHRLCRHKQEHLKIRFLSGSGQWTNGKRSNIHSGKVEGRGPGSQNRGSAGWQHARRRAFPLIDSISQKPYVHRTVISLAPCD